MTRVKSIKVLDEPKLFNEPFEIPIAYSPLNDDPKRATILKSYLEQKEPDLEHRIQAVIFSKE